MKLLALGAVASALLVSAAPSSAQGAGRCFGKPVNRVVGAGSHIHLKAGDVIWMKAGADVSAKSLSRICGDKGRQVVRGGKGQAWVSTGAGADRVVLEESSSDNVVMSGPGDDSVTGSAGNDNIFTGDGSDFVDAGGGNDNVRDDGGIDNRLDGGDGSDWIFSVGKSVSEVHGGNGTDFLFSNGGIKPNGEMEKLFGEKGNDRLKADEPHNNGPAFLDGGEGDDWFWGTPQDDVAVFHSGIKKIRMNGGDDLMVSTGRGRMLVDGGAGTDTLSFEAFTPVDRGRYTSGVTVGLASSGTSGMSEGRNTYRLYGIEDIVGSSFDDVIYGTHGEHNEIYGGLGDDELNGDWTTAFFAEITGDDVADGGLGTNRCFYFVREQRCNEDSPGDPRQGQAIVSIEKGGVLSILGSALADNIRVGYDNASDRYLVEVPSGAVPAGLCTPTEQPAQFSCPADENRLIGMLVYGDTGDDQIELDDSVPATLSTTLDGGAGANVIQGGPSKDFITTGAAGAGSVLRGGDGLDQIYAESDVKVAGQGGPDTLRVVDPCLGAELSGGDEADSIVFAGAKHAVDANIAGGYARSVDGKCVTPTKIDGDIEKLEGSFHDDHLTLGRPLPGQQGNSTLLGREGVNVLNAKNGVKNTITTGPSEHDNKVIADPVDKVIWGWGLAAY